MRRKLYNIIFAILVRVILVIHSLFTVWRASDVKDDNVYLLLALTNLLVILEGVYRIVKENGEESRWFSLCILFYIFGMVPAIWLLEIDRLEKFTKVSSSSNITNAQNEALSAINGVTLPLKLDADTWASVLEQLMLFMFVIARWMLPRGKLTRDQLSQLLFVYIGSASDVMELFVIFEEPEIRSDVTFSYVTLGVWSLSLLQFCLILTATRNIGSKAIAKHTAVDGDIPEDELGQEKDGNSACCDKVFQLEIWSLFICLILQDGPFLGVRLYAIFIKGVLSYGIIFFTAKNILILFLLCYRVIVLCYSKFTKVLDNQNRNKGFSRKSSVGPYSAEKK